MQELKKSNCLMMKVDLLFWVFMIAIIATTALSEYIIGYREGFKRGILAHSRGAWVVVDLPDGRKEVYEKKIIPHNELKESK